jgi:hypothetical protein
MQTDYEFVSIKKIKENEVTVRTKLCVTLKNIVQKILENPDDKDCRKISLLNSDVVDDLMPFDGGLESLFEIGFVEV